VCTVHPCCVFMDMFFTRRLESWWICVIRHCMRVSQKVLKMSILACSRLDPTDAVASSNLLVCVVAQRSLMARFCWHMCIRCFKLRICVFSWTSQCDRLCEISHFTPCVTVLYDARDFGGYFACTFRTHRSALGKLKLEQAQVSFGVFKQK